MLYTKELAEQLTKAIEACEIKAVEGETYSMVISEEIPDRDGETIILSGGDTKNYMKSPVVLIDHSYRVENIAGKTISLKIDGKQMIAEWVWADTEDAQLAKQLYDGGFLKTSSIGFIPLQRDEKDRSIITKWELLEWSLVAVPCNPNALSLDGKALYQKGLEKGLIKEIITETTEEGAVITPKQYEEIKSELSEIKTILKDFADGKAKKEETEAEAKELKEKKELIQMVNRGLSQALESIKKL